MTATIEDISIVATPDEDPLFDHLGEYSDQPGRENQTVDRHERGDMNQGEYRYFISTTAENPEENYQRMERFANGELASYGIRAVAKVSVRDTTQKIKTNGLWGISSDTDKKHATSVAREELEALIDILHELNIDPPKTIEAVWNKNAPWSGTLNTPKQSNVQ